MYDQADILGYIKENDVKFIRLAFCDVFGTQKNISVMPTELERAFGEGVKIGVSEIAGFENGRPDVILCPDLASFSLLPWRPSHGRVGRFFCDIKNIDGTPSGADTRHVLKKAAALAGEAGYSFEVKENCGFCLFGTDEEGAPTKTPYDRAGYMDVAPADRGENVRREICLTLEEMEITPECSYHAAGPGQNIVVYKGGVPLSAADGFITYKWAVRTIAAKNGLHASFCACPPPETSPMERRAAFTVSETGEKRRLSGADKNAAGLFVSGIERRLRELEPFLCRSGCHGTRLSVSAKICGDDGNRAEVGGLGPEANPYLVYALLMEAGLEGLGNGREEAEEGGFISKILPRAIIEAYINTKDSAGE